MVLESDLLREEVERYELSGPMSPLAIPATLHESLIARLDRLSTVKEVAQLGAVVGREFSYEMLQAVSPLNDEALEKALAQLVDVELLYQRGLPPQATYVFKHALIRDAAYESLLRSKRHQYHQRIAQALEERFSGTAKAQPEILAHHYTETGLNEQAISYWLKAGQQAVKRSANVESVSHFTHGLELIENLPETTERVQQELELQLSLGSALMVTRGCGFSETKAAFTRARELCQQLGETPELFSALRGLFLFYYYQADLRTAQELGERILNIAQSAQDPSLLIEAHAIMGDVLFNQGNFALSLDHTERGSALYDPQQHGDLAFDYMRDPGMQCLGFMSYSLWKLGYPDKALEKVNKAARLVHDLAHPYSLAGVSGAYAWIHLFRREGSAVQENAEAEIALATEYNFPFQLAFGTVFHGWAMSEQGQIEEGIAQLQQGLAAWRATGTELGLPMLYSWLAESFGKAGQIEEGLAILT